MFIANIRLVLVSSVATGLASGQFTFTPFEVSGLNDLDEVAGSGNFTGLSGPGVYVGFIRDSASNISTFPAPPGNGVEYVAGLNNAGESVVQFDTETAIASYFLRTAANSYSALPAPASDAHIPFAGLNYNGEAVGTWLLSTAGPETDGFELDLSSLQFTRFNFATGGQTYPGHWTSASAINDGGAVLGCYLDGGNINYVFGPGYPPQAGYFQCVDYLGSSGGSLQESFAPPFANTVVGINQSGEIVGRYADAGGNHGFIGTPSMVTSKPSITSTQIIPGPPEQVVFTVVDPVAGISNVLTIAFSCTVTVAPFTPGQTTPILVTATRNSPDVPADIGIEATNPAGNVTDFDPALVTVYGNGGVQPEPLSDIPASEHVLMITNGDPGLDQLRVLVNGRTINLAFKPNEKPTLNLQAWMRSSSNTIRFSGQGAPNAQASVLLSDGGSSRTGTDTGR